MGIAFLLIIILLSLFISLLFFYILSNYLVKVKYIKLKKIYIFFLILWLILFIYLSFKIYENPSINSLYYMIFLISLTAPSGILAFFILNILGFMFNIESNEVFFSILFTSLFISGYYQWFVWFPKYLKKKLKEENEKKEDIGDK